MRIQYNFVHSGGGEFGRRMSIEKTWFIHRILNENILIKFSYFIMCFHINNIVFTIGYILLYDYTQIENNEQNVIVA